jgi:hypothetical protein
MHEKNITKSYKAKGKTYYYNVPTVDVPYASEGSLKSAYGKQFESLDKAVKEAKRISKESDKYKSGGLISGKPKLAKKGWK